MELTIGSKSILGWERLPLFGRYGYVEVIKYSTTKALPFCKLYTGVSVLSVHGHLYRGWRIETYIRRFVYGWRLRRGILFPNMGGRIVFGSALQL
jgi:hypothetical protein